MGKKPRPKPPYPDPNAADPADDSIVEEARLPAEPAVDAESEAEPDAPADAAQQQQAPAPETVPVETPAELPAGRIEAIPMADLPEGVYQPRHVDVQLKSDRQRETMKRICCGLDQSGKRTLDGRRVTHMADAVRWLLEQVET